MARPTVHDSTDCDWPESEHDFGPPPAPGELGRLGKHRVLKPLGRGNMGAVYLGYADALQRKVALKVMLPDYAIYPAARTRFVREARVRSDQVQKPPPGPPTTHTFQQDNQVERLTFITIWPVEDLTRTVGNSTGGERISVIRLYTFAHIMIAPRAGAGCPVPLYLRGNEC
ncbi:MAG: pknB 23 [Gemmataceae bacterium]|nr:pknB 23 [Gemmataceae bacterium]